MNFYLPSDGGAAETPAVDMKLNLWKQEAVATLQLAAPLIIAQLLQVGMGFIDTVMAGRIGARDLAAVGLGAALWMLVLLACIGATMAIAPLIAYIKGAKKESAIAGEFHQGVWVAILVGLVAAPLTYHIAVLIPLMGVDAEIASLGTQYIQTIAWGMPGLCLYLAPRYLNEGLSNTKPVMLIQFLLLPLNIFGNYLFMYGNFGMPAMGAVGAAVSTAISLWMGALMMYAYLTLTPRYRSLNLFSNFSAPNPREIGRILKLGLPIAVSIIMESSLFSGIALLMGSFGKIEMAAHQIAINYASMMFMIPLGLSQAITIRVGHASGGGNFILARRRGWTGIVMAGGFMALSASFMLLFPDLIVSFYTSDSEVSAMVLTLLFAAALFQFSDGLQVSAAGSLRGLKDTSIPMVITIISYWVVGFPVAWLLGFHFDFGPIGLWSGLVIGLTCAAILLNIRFFIMSNRFVMSDL